FFFFSSRRRHTRSYGDWSSDVCSSDLVESMTILQACSRWNRRVMVCPRGGYYEARKRPAASFWISTWLSLVKPNRDRTIGSVVRSEERRVGKECRSGGWR